MRLMPPGYAGDRETSRTGVTQIMTTITGTVGSSGKYLVTGAPVDVQMHSVLKIVFENKTSGTNLGLLIGTDADFASGTGGIQLSGSGGPGFQFLTITDTHKLSGKIMFIRREVGAADSQFSLTVE
jgi:hypothetical protein